MEESQMSDVVHPVSKAFKEQANINAEQYERMYQESTENPDVLG